MKLHTLFARKEPTTDVVSISHGLGHRKDVVLYQDEACTQPYARWSWHLTGQPRRNSKTVMLNCYRWAIQWVPDLQPTHAMV